MEDFLTNSIDFIVIIINVVFEILYLIMIFSIPGLLPQYFFSIYFFIKLASRQHVFFIERLMKFTTHPVFLFEYYGILAPIELELNVNRINIRYMLIYLRLYWLSTTWSNQRFYLLIYCSPLIWFFNKIQRNQKFWTNMLHLIIKVVL